MAIHPSKYQGYYFLIGNEQSFSVLLKLDGLLYSQDTTFTLIDDSGKVIKNDVRPVSKKVFYITDLSSGQFQLKHNKGKYEPIYFNISESDIKFQRLGPVKLIKTIKKEG